MATDFGTEAGIVTLEPIPMDQLYPLAAHMNFEVEGEVFADSPPEFMLDLRAVLFVPDSLHVMHNITEDVLEAMKNFLNVKPHFKSVANFL